MFGTDQHHLPAAYIGRFSSNNDARYRDRVVWVRRRTGTPFPAAARYAAKRRGQYDQDDPGMFWRADKPDTGEATASAEGQTLDACWRFEGHLTSALDALENPTRPLDGKVWAKILVPFVSSLFVRGPDFASDFQSRIPGVTGPGLELADAKLISSSYHDNTLGGMIIEWQRLLAPIIAAEWTVFHCDEPLLITNDLARSLMRNVNGYGISCAIPLSPRSLLSLTARPARKILEWRDAAWVAQVSHRPAPRHGFIEGSRQMYRCAFAEVYGPTKSSVSDLGDSPVQRPYVGPWGTLTNRTTRGLIPYMEDFFRLLTALEHSYEETVRTDINIDWAVVARSWLAPVILELNVSRFPGGLFITSEQSLGINLDRFSLADVERSISDAQREYENAHKDA